VVIELLNAMAINMFVGFGDERGRAHESIRKSERRMRKLVPLMPNRPVRPRFPAAVAD
jgi:hypothetical protein